MRLFFQKILTFILNNKKHVLPHLFTFPIMFVLTLIPIPANILNWLYLPFFFWFGLRAMSKADAKELPWGYTAFIVVLLPFLIFLFFSAVFVIFYGITGINVHQQIESAIDFT